MSASEQESQRPVIKDRRRIDPVTGQPRPSAGNAEQAAASGASAGQAARGGSSGSSGSTGTGQPRPGRHAASKPGGLRPEAAGGASADQASPAQAQAQAQADPDPNQPRSDHPATGDEHGTDQHSTDQHSTDQHTAHQHSTANETGTKPTASGSDVAARLAERTADLQRLQAEYANYRKRVERDRAAVREHALASVLAELLPVLDDIGRAREHEELTGGFKAVAEALEAVAVKLGLTAFGEAGEAFDPNVHEALMHSYSPDVSEPTAVQILQPGYKVGERILRPARVAVAEPTDPAGARMTAETDDAANEGSESATAPDDAE
jgi:molecular chaperone GrpE